MPPEPLERYLDHAVEAALDDLSRIVRPIASVIINVPVEIRPMLAFKPLTCSIAARQRLEDYEHCEKYGFAEFRDVAPEGDVMFYGHPGVRRRILESRIRRRFELGKIHFSPIDTADKWFAGQVWFICPPLNSSSRANEHKSGANNVLGFER
jgi:hypothetical protein